jgi:hypothetical protein
MGLKFCLGCKICPSSNPEEKKPEEKKICIICAVAFAIITVCAFIVGYQTKNMGYAIAMFGFFGGIHSIIAAIVHKCFWIVVGYVVGACIALAILSFLIV